MPLPRTDGPGPCLRLVRRAGVSKEHLAEPADHHQPADRRNRAPADGQHIQPFRCALTCHKSGPTLPWVTRRGDPCAGPATRPPRRCRPPGLDGAVATWTIGGEDEGSASWAELVCRRAGPCTMARYGRDGARRAGLARQSAPLTLGQRRRRCRLDPVRLNSAANCAIAGTSGPTLCLMFLV